MNMRYQHPVMYKIGNMHPIYLKNRLIQMVLVHLYPQYQLLTIH